MSTHRLRRVVLLGVVGAMVLSLLPSGPAAADITDICEGAPPLAFTDNASIAAVQAPYVQCLAAYGITRGFPDGRYGPGESVTRQQMASFIARLATQAQNGNLDIPTTAPAAFTDVDPTNTHYHAINWLAELGITTGVSPGIYDPGGLVTRQAMASFISRAHQTLGVFDAEDIDDIVSGFEGDPFTDIATASSVHRPNIEVLQALGIIGGFTDGTYRPGEPVTRQQMARFLMESAALLDANGLWNGQFVPEDPTDPDEPDTPDTPDVPEPPEPEPTNQAFDVVPAYTQVPRNYDLDVTVDVGDAEEVSIWLLDAQGVFYDGLVVSFLADGAGDFDAPLAQPGINLTEVDGVSIPASQARTVQVGDDGVIELVVNTFPMSPDQFVVLVAETDDLAGGPELDDDAEPVEAFGVSPVITVQDVEGIVLVDDATGNPIIDATRPENATVNVTATLIDYPDPLYPAARVVDAAGEIEWLIAEVLPAQVCQQTLTLSTVTVAQTLSTGSATLVEGSASFAVPGGADLDEYCILTSWEGVGPYDGEDAEAFDLSGVGLPDHGKITYSNAPAEPAEAVFVDEDDRVVLVNGTASIAVRVTDQYEQPAAGEVVEFTVNEGDTGLVIDDVVYERTTNASGIATLSYSSNANRIDRATAIVLDEMSMDLGIGPSPLVDVRVLWYVNAAPDESMPTVSPVEAYDADAEWILVAITNAAENAAAVANGDLLRYSYTTGQVFNDTLFNNVTRAAFGADLGNASGLQILFADDPNTPTVFNTLP